MNPPRPGMVRLTAVRGPVDRRPQLTMILTAPPDPSGGVGGFEGTDRPLRRPARWFRAPSERTQSLQVLIDVDRIGGPSVERRLEVLEALATKPEGEDSPPPVRLTGDVRDPYSRGGGLWVIQDIQYGERLFNSDGALRRQALTIDLVDFEEIEPIKPLSIKRTRTGGKRRRRTITTHKGDTLRGIAVRELGRSSAWTEIREWNKKTFGKTDPDAPLRAGVRVTLR